MNQREDILWVDATPDADYAIRILEAYLDMQTRTYAVSLPPVMAEVMNQASRERALILQFAINKLRSA